MFCTHNCRIYQAVVWTPVFKRESKRLRGVGLYLAVSARSSVVWAWPWSVFGVVKKVQMFAGQPVLPLLLLAAVSSAAEQTVFCLVGDTITLSLVIPMSERISRILWKYDTDMVADWTHGHFLSYGRFKDRATVDNTTGLLKIRSGTTEDSGRYEVEVNDRLQDLVYEVKVIKRVPKPIVWIQPLKCGPSSLQCTLSCDGSTEGAGPITYSWASGGGDWTQSAKLFPITNNTANVATFSCRMENPISYQESDPKANPFFPEDKSQPIITTIITCVVIVFVIVTIVLLVLYRNRIGTCFLRRAHIPVMQCPPPAENSPV